MSVGDYHYYPLRTNGPYQQKLEGVSDEFSEAYGQAELLDHLLSNVLFEVAAATYPGMGEVIGQAMLPAAGFLADNLSTILYNVATALTQISDTMSIVDPQYDLQ